MINLDSFSYVMERQAEGLEVKIMTPDKRDTGLRIRIAGPDSKVSQEAFNARADERLKSTSEVMTAQEAREEGALLLARLTLGWNEFSRGGKPYKFSVENATKLYLAEPWIMEQVDSKAGSRKHFFSKSDEDLSLRSIENSPLETSEKSQ